jgi:hypothetical protein
MDKQQLREKLEAELPHFTGIENWYRQRYPWLRRQFLITDGVKYLADTAKCYWLIDLIASYFPKRQVMAEPFQVWVLAVREGNQATIAADDGNGKHLASQEIPYTDFPLDEITLYVTNDAHNGIVVMLPSEY